MTIDWALVVTSYFLVGAALLIGLLLHHRLTRVRRSDWVRVAMEAVEPERRTLGYKVRADLAAPALGGVFVWAFWPVALALMAKWKLDEVREQRGTNGLRLGGAERPEVEPEDLLQRTTIEEIEQREIVQDPLGAVPALPFGHLSAGWIRFRSHLEPGDEIWAFRAVRSDDWGGEEQLSGYAAVRLGKVVGHFVARRGRPAN
jgi:hypothetical protein